VEGIVYEAKDLYLHAYSCWMRHVNLNTRTTQAKEWHQVVTSRTEKKRKEKEAFKLLSLIQRQ